MKFETDFRRILKKIDEINPEAYAKTRNYANGAVTQLSPYISRGVVSTKMVVAHIYALKLPYHQTEKLIQELTWRDYWQQVWKHKGDAINTDLLSPQSNVLHHEMPKSMIHAQTGIDAIDSAILALYQEGYMHNHMRMYVASVACNIGKSHWHTPAKWMYYHLLDGDWASNALSWQWVAGCNSKKKYYANQENINHFFYGTQSGTFLDESYETLPNILCPEILKETEVPQMTTQLPESHAPRIDNNYPTLLYNYYNMDPLWRKDEKANRILLLEPSFFKKDPISQKCLDFLLALRINIPDIQVYTGEFSQFQKDTKARQCVFKEHPLNKHYVGIEEPRDWIFDVGGYYPSFFSYWKHCK
ncbi:FAD-binding domain-containing protein [Arenibacter sp. GZD96]|uniref:FAD-binding domain-containing protein n=1 Tax=Aurantibrevibacter litoralis TaxID=3106030 RepID=UPI002AFF0FCE|nr:FAD-binding domain-containing protein [Arenibacter sp. GZD-96]MEA1785178.1 FAD-binding domain-containing protein [Arenibacter sp. GZD-96]